MHCPGAIANFYVLHAILYSNAKEFATLHSYGIGQIYLILRTTHIHAVLALLHVLSWLHHWLSPLITCFAPPQHTTWLRAWADPAARAVGLLAYNNNKTEPGKPAALDITISARPS